MPVAAVPDYLGKDFSTASPGLRFGMYFQGWVYDWKKYVPDQKKSEPSALKSACKLNDNDLTTMKSLLARQQVSFKVVSCGVNSLQLEAISTAPFATGLGNEHPTENGFAFLNPYGLPYLPGSGVKGVLRQAAKELAPGKWDTKNEWSNEKKYPLCVNGKPVLDKHKEPILLSILDVLFGRETADGDKEQLRGALTFWDVIPQIKGDSLAVEIMTPHQKHYYQDGQTPHDSGQPIPITFLTVPPGSGFIFHVQCNLPLLEHTAPELAKNKQWQKLLQAAFEHAFDWLGFGAKTAVGYGAMAEDKAKKAEREELLRQQQEAERRSTLSPEDLAYEENTPVINKFKDDFEQATAGAYQAGGEFDSKRNIFIEKACTWKDQRSRDEAAEILDASIKWGASKKGKERLKNALSLLKKEKE